MKIKHAHALKYGRVVKSQSFETAKGIYRIVLVRYREALYFAKYLDDKIVECCEVLAVERKKKPRREENRSFNEEKKGGS